MSTSASSTTFRRFDPGRDEAAVRRILCLAFGGTNDGVGSYLDLVGRDSMRVLDDGGEHVPACLARIPMGQYFGGRSVPMVGIAAVGVAPEARGARRALALMQGCVRELAAERMPLSCLYASTQALYRHVGFEQAGSKFEFRIPLRQLTEGTRDVPIVAIESADDRVKACYREYAARFDGMLDRGPFIWSRVKQSRDAVFHGFAVVPHGADGPIEGYLYFAQHRRDGGRHDVSLSDLAFTTPRAGLRLLGLLRDFTSMGLTLSFTGGPSHPLVVLLQQQWVEASLREWWMLRIVDLERAIEARGYAPATTVDVVIDVTDELVPANAGRWTIEVANGHGGAHRHAAAGPAVRTNARGLAAMYSGFMSPMHAALVGLAEGPAEALERLGAAFAGNGPWMPDHF
ncbi:MAG: GNAT family N-acetyltransferase [Phycisphaerales bacterium]